VADMTGEPLMTIGELATLAGLPVKKVRFWSDQGIVPPAARSGAGYRLYGQSRGPCVGSRPVAGPLYRLRRDGARRGTTGGADGRRGGRPAGRTAGGADGRRGGRPAGRRRCRGTVLRRWT
jgi:MerR family regulatory protein